MSKKKYLSWLGWSKHLAYFFLWCILPCISLLLEYTPIIRGVNIFSCVSPKIYFRLIFPSAIFAGCFIIDLAYFWFCSEYLKKDSQSKRFRKFDYFLLIIIAAVLTFWLVCYILSYDVCPTYLLFCIATILLLIKYRAIQNGIEENKAMSKNMERGSSGEIESIETVVKNALG